jgi:hypothetical protein
VLALQDEFSVSITVTEDPDRDIKDEPCGKPILEIIKKR